MVLFIHIIHPIIHIINNILIHIDIINPTIPKTPSPWQKVGDETIYLGPYNGANENYNT